MTWIVLTKSFYIFLNLPYLEHYNDTVSPNFELIHQALNHLAGDKDHDVREAAAHADRVKPNPPPKQEVPADPVPEPRPAQVEALPTWAQIAEVIQEIK